MKRGSCLRRIVAGSIGMHLALALLSCNHLFYYPDKTEHGTPDQLGFRWSEHFLKSGPNKIHVWHIPSNMDKSFGRLIHFHGNAQNMTAHFLFSFWLHYFGFDLILFDYSGYGKSEGNPERSQTVTDGKAVLEWSLSLVRHEIPNPLYILGQSLGGAVAVAVLGTETKTGKVRAMVLDSTFVSYRRLARKKLSDLWLTWPLQYPLSLLVSDEAAPREFMKDLSLPVLAFHSSSDPVVPYSEGLDLYQGLGRPAQIETLHQPGHTLALSVQNPAFRETFVRFLCHHSDDKSACLRHLKKNEKYLDLKTAFRAGIPEETEKN